MRTGRVGSLQRPVSICRVSNHLVIPSDDKVPGCALEQGRTRKAVHVQFGFRWHGENEILLKMIMTGADVCDVIADIPYVFEMHVSVWAPGWI